MLRIGLTGGIGSGKSTVTDIFSALGTPVIDTDEIAHSLLQPDGIAYEKIIEVFGDSVLAQDRTIDRRKLAKIVFSAKTQKKQLEAILHPLIWLIVEQKISQLNAPYCIIAVPLLVEGNHQKRFDRVLLVTADKAQRIARIQKRDNRTTDEINAIINSQASDSARQNAADDVIFNTDTRKKLLDDVTKLHNMYLELAEQPL